MKLEIELPVEYGSKLWTMPAFKRNGKITERVRASLENTLYIYSDVARIHAKHTENNPRNFKVNSVSIVGSCAQSNRADSDIDYLLICPDVDERSTDALKTVMAYVLFCERSKNEAIDVFIGKEYRYPERPTVDITSQVKSLIGRCNYNLLKK